VSKKMGNNQGLEEATHQLGSKIKHNFNENITKPITASNIKGKLKSLNKKESKESAPAEGGLNNLYQGIKIENDPMEREIYVKCPSCNRKVFDSGLSNNLSCENCDLQFNGGKKYTANQIQDMRIKASQEQMQQEEEEEEEDEEEEEEEEEFQDIQRNQLNRLQRETDPFKRATDGKGLTPSDQKDLLMAIDHEEEKK